ncbi:MAG: hypothetical protein ACREPE_13765 [Lysobacter sp.]
MEDNSGYAVFFFPQALEVLGDALKPYLREGPGGAHVLCREIDTGGAFIEMTLDGLTADAKPVELELMIPGNMVRMIVSARSDESFGFAPRLAVMTMASTPAAAATDAAAPATTADSNATPEA